MYMRSIKQILDVTVLIGVGVSSLRTCLYWESWQSNYMDGGPLYCQAVVTQLLALKYYTTSSTTVYASDTAAQDTCHVAMHGEHSTGVCAP